MKIDLAALRRNYLTFAEAAAPAECAAVVKADAYGLGIGPVAGALWRAGCRTFFVAFTQEALDLRALLPEAVIYVLNGLCLGAAETLAANALRPALCSVEAAEEWAARCRTEGRRLPAALHVETGINRLGLNEADLDRLTASPRVLESFTIGLVMSHLSCADEPEAPANAAQLERFEALRRKLPATPASLANSAGSLNGPAYGYDLVRVGVGLYGGRPHPDDDATVPPATVVRLFARIAQVRRIAAGESVGYGATWTAARDGRIAVIPVGYADGYPRGASSKPNSTPTSQAPKTPSVPPAYVSIGGRDAPVVGRISMDMITVDVTDLPETLATVGAEAELFGLRPTVDELARSAGTISHELFTGLGSRFTRLYSSDETFR